MTRVALIHDWLTGMRGGEYVLEAIAELFPKAELFTLLYIPGKIAPILTTLKRHTSALQKFPGVERKYRHYLPFMPKLIESFDLSGFDLILSSSHCVAKGIRKPPGSVHISYIHAPMRYMWDRYDDYFGPERASFPVRLGVKMFRSYLQNWDKSVSSKERIDYVMANSQFIAEQVSRIYQRPVDQVVYPFADLSRFSRSRTPSPTSSYLMVTAFAPYKKVDMAIHAFNDLKLPLMIVGSGQDESRLKKIAGPTVDFLGPLSNQAIADLYAQCRAFIFPGIEDFGITPVEAMAAGAPVIAFNQGGVTETVTEKTGVFFSEPTPQSLAQAILQFEASKDRFLEKNCRERASQFSRNRFQKEFSEGVFSAWKTAGKDPQLLPIARPERF